MKNLNLEDVMSESQEFAQVRLTDNYKLFGFIKGNREIDPANVKKITQSIAKKAIKEIAIIVGFNPDSSKGKTLLIIDGQHRFQAYVSLGLPVPFIIREDFDINDPQKSLEDVERVNTASATWDVTDFMMSKCELGDKNYLNYKEIKEKYSFEHEILFFMLNKKEGRPRINHESFKNSGLALSDEDKMWLKSNLDILSLFYNKFSEESGKRYWFKAIIELMFTEGVDLLRLNTQLNDNKFKVPPTNTIKHSLEIIRDLYNDKLRKNKLFVGADGKNYDIYVK
jgi:hypothetical protein